MTECKKSRSQLTQVTPQSTHLLITCLSAHFPSSVQACKACRHAMCAVPGLLGGTRAAASNMAFEVHMHMHSRDLHCPAPLCIYVCVRARVGENVHVRVYEETCEPCTDTPCITRISQHHNPVLIPRLWMSTTGACPYHSSANTTILSSGPYYEHCVCVCVCACVCVWRGGGCERDLVAALLVSQHHNPVLRPQAREVKRAFAQPHSTRGVYNTNGQLSVYTRTV